MKSASSKETLDNFFNTVDDEDFAYALIQILVHSFLAAEDSGVQVNNDLKFSFIY